jgi:truncated hemoglobin YjbI
MSDDRGVEPGARVPTLYEWAGGREALEKLFTRFYEIVPADDLLGPLFAGMDRWAAAPPWQG